MYVMWYGGDPHEVVKYQYKIWKLNYISFCASAVPPVPLIQVVINKCRIC